MNTTRTFALAAFFATIFVAPVLWAGSFNVLITQKSAEDAVPHMVYSRYVKASVEGNYGLIIPIRDVAWDCSTDMVPYPKDDSMIVRFDVKSVYDEEFDDYDLEAQNPTWVWSHHLPNQRPAYGSSKKLKLAHRSLVNYSYVNGKPCITEIDTFWYPND